MVRFSSFQDTCRRSGEGYHRESVSSCVPGNDRAQQTSHIRKSVRKTFYFSGIAFLFSFSVCISFSRFMLHFPNAD